MWWFPGEGSALCVPVVELLSHRVVRRSPGGWVVGADVGLQVLADLAERGKAARPLERLPGITAHVDQMNVQIAQGVQRALHDADVAGQGRGVGLGEYLPNGGLLARSDSSDDQRSVHTSSSCVTNSGSPVLKANLATKYLCASWNFRRPPEGAPVRRGIWAPIRLSALQTLHGVRPGVESDRSEENTVKDQRGATLQHPAGLTVLVTGASGFLRHGLLSRFR